MTRRQGTRERAITDKIQSRSFFSPTRRADACTAKDSTQDLILIQSKLNLGHILVGPIHAHYFCQPIYLFPPAPVWYVHVDHGRPDHLPPVVGQAGQQVPLVVAEAVGDKEDGAPLRLLSVRRLLVLLAGQRQHEGRGVQVLHQLRLLLDSLQEHQDEKCGDGID